MKKLFGFIIILCVIPNCLFGQLSSDYNPMNIGNYWIQHTDTLFGGYNPTTFRMDIEGIDRINGLDYFRMKQEQKADDGSQDSTVWYVWTGQDSTGGLLGAFGYTSDLDSAFIYDPPIISSPIEANTVGYSWEYDMPGTGGGGQHFTNVIESFSETVEVPTGTYDNCMKISTIITDTTGDTTQTYDHFYAQEVGQILNEGWSLWAGNHKYELIEYNVKTFVESIKSSNVPVHFRLEQNFPNPFNSETIICYQIAETEFVNLSIYNITGQLVETLANENTKPGYYQITWRTNNLSSGFYFYKLTAGKFSDVKKALYLK